MKHKGVTLEGTDLNRFEEKAIEGVAALSTFGLGDTTLSLFHDEGNTRVYQRKIPGSPHGKFTSAGILPITLDDIYYAFYNPNSQDHRTYLALHHGADYLEGTVLNTMLTETPDDPFLWFGAKYMKIYMPGTTMFEPRDATYVEYSASSVDKQGRRFVFILKETQIFHEAPPYQEVVRIQFSSMQLYTELENGQVDFVSRLVMGSVGKIPSFVIKKLLLQELLIGNNLPQMLQKRRLLDSTPLNGAAAPPIKESRCTTCASKFGAFRSAYYCSTCGHSMCKNCRVLVYRALHVKSVSPVIKLCFCKTCSIEARCTRTSGRRASTQSQSRSTGDGAMLAGSEKSRSSSDSATMISVNGGITQGWMESSTTYSNDEPHPIEILHQMQTSLEDQRLLLQMMRMKLANQQGNYSEISDDSH